MRRQSHGSASCAVVVPIYRETLPPEDEFSLDYSLAHLSDHDVIFAAPEALELSYYKNRYPKFIYESFADSFFKSISGYNQLLLSEHFYERFAKSEFILILQTDAIILRDELDYWCQQPFDWIGAPWPDGQMLTITTTPFSQLAPKKIYTHVGNGGLSLRRTRPTVQLLSEFAETRDEFLKRQWNEDLFFSLLGTQSLSYQIPSEKIAARFALEAHPEKYARLLCGQSPMGGHAWYHYNIDFWLPLLDRQLPATIASDLRSRKMQLGFWQRLIRRSFPGYFENKLRYPELKTI